MVNVFLLTLDAFRDDVVGPERTPFLSWLSSNGVTFTEAVATGSGTSTAFPGILAGVLPLEYGYAMFRDEHTTVAERLPDTIRTVGISSSTPTSRVYGFDRGFDEFVDSGGDGVFGRFKRRIRKNEFLYATGKRVLSLSRRLSVGDGSENVPYDQAKEVTDTLRRMVGRHGDGDLFVWAHYMDAHTPYHPPERCYPDDGSPALGREAVNDLLAEYNKNRPRSDAPGEGRRLTDAEMDALRYHYRAEAKFVDEQVKRAFDAIEATCDEFVLIVCADHGEEFGEHGHHGHLPKLYQELIHVPLIVYHSDGPSTTVERPVSVARLPVTIADVFDVEPAEDWRGESLFAELDADDGDDDRYVLSELSHTTEEGLGGDVQPEKARVSVRDGSWKYIHDRQDGTDELYDLSADPDESGNLIAEETERAQELRSVCRDRLARLTGTDSDIDVPDDVSERLENLGYM